LQPNTGNAVKSYKEILSIDPKNSAANQGLRLIESRFLDIGILELERNDLKQAEVTLKQLASINKDSDDYQSLSDAIKNWKIISQTNSFNELGVEAFNSENFILPAKKNALYYFKQALELDETNETAIEGIQKVANEFVEQANLAIIANEYQAAAAHLATISIIDPEHKSIKTLDTALNRALRVEQKAAEKRTAQANSSFQQTTASPTRVSVSQGDSTRTLSRQTIEQQTFDKQYLKEGLEAYYQGDYLKAASLLQPLADKGIARAQFRLAYMYYLGRGFDKDTVTADSMIRAALPAVQKFADDNRPWAQSDLGSLYEDGLVLARDFSKAVTWYRSAAEQGYPGAQTNLGMMYARGRGVDSNQATAIEWFKKAANQGDNVAKRNLIAMGVNNN
jgi:TPR repeat protein